MSSDDLDISGLKVMVIDDSKTIRRTAETLLKKAGCEVLTAIDGFEALSIIADNHPDLILVQAKAIARIYLAHSRLRCAAGYQVRVGRRR